MKHLSSSQVLTLLQKSLAVALAVTTISLVATMLAAPAASAQDVIPSVTAQVAQADTMPPSDVDNVKATAGEGQVTLSWDAATDNVGVTGYKIYYGANPVVEDGDSYDLGPIDAGDKLTETAKGLNNGTTYYFAVTAYDAAGNESESYSVEVSATPGHGAADSTAPTVMSAGAVDRETVKVIFSEAVTLPVLNAEAAFTIRNDDTQAILEVRKAVMDPMDSTSKTVILTTAFQEAGTNYIVTAGFQVKDLAGNPVSSGTSDTALFSGSDKAPVVATQETQVAAADTTGPELISVSAVDPTHLIVNFNEQVKLSATPTDNFLITEEDSPDNMLMVKEVTLGEDKKTVFLTTDPQKTMNYNLYVFEVTDLAGNMILVESSSTVFFGGVAADTTGTQETIATQEPVGDPGAPEDASELAASMAGEALVKLVWKASPNTAGNLAGYMLYQGTNGTVYSAGVSIPSTATSAQLSELAPGVKYFFKLTAKDAEGNESKGIFTTFMLPGTGPELGLLLLGSLGLGKLMKRRRTVRKGGGGCGSKAVARPEGGAGSAQDLN